MDFLEVIEYDCAGNVKIEIDLARSKVQPEGARVVRVEMWVRVLLGSPEMIGGKLVYPVELPGVGNYDHRADGDAPDDQIGNLVLKRALDTAWRGASALLDVSPTTPLELSGLNLAGSGRLTAILKHVAK